MEGPHLCWQKMSKKPLTFPRKLWNVLSQKPLNSQLNFSPVKKIDIVYVKIVISILSFFSFLNFFCLNILLGFLGFIFKVHKLSSKFDFFFFSLLQYPWLDFTIFFSHACVYFRLYCSRQCSYSFWHFFLLHEKNFWQHLFFKYISHYYRLSSKQHFSQFCLF